MATRSNLTCLNPTPFWLRFLFRLDWYSVYTGWNCLANTKFGIKTQFGLVRFFGLVRVLFRQVLLYELFWLKNDKKVGLSFEEELNKLVAIRKHWGARVPEQHPKVTNMTVPTYTYIRLNQMYKEISSCRISSKLV